MAKQTRILILLPLALFILSGCDTLLIGSKDAKSAKSSTAETPEPSLATNCKITTCASPAKLDTATCSCVQENEVCKEDLAQLTEQVKTAGICASDADCVDSKITACPIGCGAIVNKASDVSALEAALASYTDKCGTCQFDCGYKKGDLLQCVNNQCVAKTQESADPPPAGTPDICITPRFEIGGTNDQEAYIAANCPELSVACENASQCTGVTGPCGHPRGVNKAFEGPFSNYQRLLSAMVDCAEGPAVVSYDLSCEANRCVAINIAY